MQSNIVYYLLQMKLQLNKTIRYVKSTLLSISDLIHIDENNNIRNITIRFILIRFLRYIQYLFQILINMLNYNVHRVQLVKNYIDGQKTFIICAKNNEQLLITDILDINLMVMAEVDIT